MLSKAFGVGAVYWNLRRFCTKPSLMYRSYKPKRLVSKKIMKRWTIAKECRLKQLQKQLTAAKLSTLLCLFYFTFFCILVSWYPINQLINRLLRIRQHDKHTKLKKKTVRHRKPPPTPRCSPGGITISANGKKNPKTKLQDSFRITTKIVSLVVYAIPDIS